MGTWNGGGEMPSRTKLMRRRRRRRRRSGSVRMKVRKLQRLVPGGQEMRPDRLFLQTADYILHLRSQLHVLQALNSIYKR